MFSDDTSTRHRLYVLNDLDQPIECRNQPTWSRWMQNSLKQRMLARHHVGPYIVTTAFVGFDQAERRSGPPLLYRTHIVHRDGDSHPFETDSWMWFNRIAARYGHRVVVRTIRNHLKDSGSDPCVVDVIRLAQEEDTKAH